MSQQYQKQKKKWKEQGRKEFAEELIREIKDKINKYDDMAREQARLREISDGKIINVNEHSIKKWENQEASRILRDILGLIKQKVVDKLKNDEN